jgi:hypothetical protein
MVVDYTAQFAKRARYMYADFFCSQYIESVVSPIFVDNNNEKGRKTIQGHYQAIKRKSKREKKKKKLMIIVISSVRTLLY